MKISVQLKMGCTAVHTHAQTWQFPYCKSRPTHIVTPTTYSYAGTKKNGSVWYQIGRDVRGDAGVGNGTHDPTTATRRVVLRVHLMHGVEHRLR
jgi:hypothetical protein